MEEERLLRALTKMMQDSQELSEDFAAARRKLDALAERDGIQFGADYTLDATKPFLIEEDTLAAFEAMVITGEKLYESHLLCEKAKEDLMALGIVPPWIEN